ncbi:hypothetical protein GlitD10_1279 [Gloeomargarita lithophora Alchichica-D10]|uniref:Uncharacterized protein n=1 Tax=Gloeomargarita lithophora Alchichica-D10 TaxID=1188229 RepID=A0A1J0ACF2_9CYAN|nr:hypothetical protein [Gloeomargarita lithophora]APB33599.1 hypothetical protein GlitD10_1279 [Gloeomargarita lithophora Alchichica-D10]
MGQEPLAYGVILATQVADYLVNHGELGTLRHRDYCGVALGYAQGRFFYDHVYDGEFGGLMPAERSPIATFAHRDEFIAWLAAQSDASLSGCDQPHRFYWHNQRLTRTRIEAALAQGLRIKSENFSG